MKKIFFFFLILAGIISIVAGLIYLAQDAKPLPVVVTDYYSCVEAGNPVMESFPEQCAHEGTTYVRDIGNMLALQDDIRVTSPQPGESFSMSIIRIEGEARGYWFFEGVMNGKLVSNNYFVNEGNPGVEKFIYEEFQLEAGADWMTEDFVPFSGGFIGISGDQLSIIIEKANPSGLAENDERLVIPIRIEDPFAGNAQQ